MPGTEPQPALNLSIVVPVLDEADNLPVLWRELFKANAGLTAAFDAG